MKESPDFALSDTLNVKMTTLPFPYTLSLSASHEKLHGLTNFPGPVYVSPENASPASAPVSVRFESNEIVILAPAIPGLFFITTGTLIVSPTLAVALCTSNTGTPALTYFAVTIRLDVTLLKSLSHPSKV